MRGVIIGVVIGVVVVVGLVAHDRVRPLQEVICESGEQTTVWEDYTLWVSQCHFLDGRTVPVRMID